MINNKMIVGVFALFVVLGAFGFVTASHIHSTSTVLTVGDGGNDNNSNGGDGHAGGNPDPTTGRIAPATVNDGGNDNDSNGGDGHVGQIEVPMM